MGSYVHVTESAQKDLGDLAPRASDEEVQAFLASRASKKNTNFSLSDWPPPGGFGAGVAFLPGKLLFDDSSAIYYYLAAPRNIGTAPQADLLYMTSSNRASKGCEALLSFFRSEGFNAVFRIWDWSTPPQPNGSQFIYSRGYDALKDYLIPYEVPTDGGTLTLDVIYVVSVTRRENSGWINEVYLHNHSTGERERVWSHSFQWAKTQNDEAFWWGPIFETFPPGSAHYGPTNPLGFADTLVVQDQWEYQLTSENSTLQLPTQSGFRVLYRSPDTNSALICD